jgi:anaerobic ribonucleoside-triphosphate reductase activating protein
VSGIVPESVVDGPGLRYVVFTQGCPHRCKGCHNPETHDPGGGSLLDARTMLEQFRANPLLAGMTFSGGEPFLQPGPLCFLASRVREEGKTVIVYSGYTLENLWSLAAGNPDVGVLLSLADTLIDGPYIEELRDLNLRFRGSSNQRELSPEDIRRGAPGAFS